MDKIRLGWVLVVFVWVHGLAPAVHPAGAEEKIIGQNEIVERMAPRTRGITFESAPTTSRPNASRQMALPEIQFEFNSDRFTRNAQAQVRELGKALQTATLLPFSFKVAGHTDSVGASVYNRGLSLRRAMAVKRALVEEMGVVGDRLIEVGLGEKYPIPGLAPDDGRNRRVEVANLGALAPRGKKEDTRRRATKRALVVGIGAYQHVSRLNGPVNDAEDIAAFLIRHRRFEEGDIRILRDAEATRKNILVAVDEWLVQGTTAGDEVFLYYSGHGFQQPDEDGDEEDRLDETLVPVDAFVTNDGRVEGMITDDEMRALLDRMRGRNVQVVIDACHSGTSTRAALGDSWRYTKTPRLPDGSRIRVNFPRTRGVGLDPGRESFLSSDGSGLLVWSAVRADQTALVDREAKERRGSVFTRRLLWGVRDGKADDDGNGTVTVEELQRYVMRESKAYCTRHADDCGRGLTPQVHTTQDRFDKPAFGNAARPLGRNATLAKDLLVRPSADPAALPGGSVRLSVEPGSTLRLGTEIDIVVESDRAGYLYVLDIDAAGKLVQIFPNQESLRAGVSSQIRAGQRVSLPGEGVGFRFRTVPPSGRGLLLAVVSDRNERLGDLAGRHKDLAVVPSPEAYLVEVGEALRAGRREQPNGSGWSIASLEYEIIAPDTK